MMKGKDKKIEYGRHVILTCVPSAKRKEVYTQLRENRLRMIMPFMNWAMIFTICFTLFNFFTIKSQGLYGFLIGVDLLMGMLLISVYDAIGTLWREPDDKEIDELGDQIV